MCTAPDLCARAIRPAHQTMRRVSTCALTLAPALALTLALALALSPEPVLAFATATEQLLVAGFLAGGTFGLAIVGACVLLYARRVYTGGRARASFLPELDEDD